MDLVPIQRTAAALLALLIAGCSSFSHFNDRASSQGAANKAPRATLAVSGERGNPRVLVFLTLSGGGSRAAVWSTEVVLRLQSVFDDVDLLAEVDAISSVSGGSMAGAYYAATRDVRLRDAALARALAPLGQVGSPGVHGEMTASGLHADSRTGVVTCGAPLTSDQRQSLERAALPADAVRRIATLCEQASLSHLRAWEPDQARKAMRRNYLARWFGNWFWPTNAAAYWFTAFDRADIMAQTLADNLYDTPLLGHDLALGDLNATRPYLIINATQASSQHTEASDDDFPFGSVFTFTAEDFGDRLNSGLASYPLARAVMASSAFPLVFANTTLRDFRTHASMYCLPERNEVGQCSDERYLHVFDGGNADNLGLRSVKRVLLQMTADGRLEPYDAIVVITVDAYTRPRGASPINPDPRGPIGMLVDLNVSDAVDSLLQANRAKLLGEFGGSVFRWDQGDCAAESRHLPQSLCDALADRGVDQIDLRDRLVFYHVGFADVTAFNAADFEPRQLKRQLDAIPTSFKIDERDAGLLQQAAAHVLRADNGCLLALREVLRSAAPAPQQVRDARSACQTLDRVDLNGRSAQARGAARPVLLSAP